ncbi:AGAP001051-PA [Anopheles gambiae str. PEST]|uniref:AGAP001051-PA n=2 Tax=gambiae species complex TaxID=44542 RepID=Q7Q2H5_ANOGA|nr:glycosaminoglycan xylosylkinase homolog isoform X1 [Anopheles coluzzii]EAA13435.2 AGAP001051-PA [Anopheles gambiae str. PEST]
MTNFSFYNLVLLLCLSFVIYYSLNIYLFNDLQSTVSKSDFSLAEHHALSKQVTKGNSFSKNTTSNSLLSVHKAIVVKSKILKPVFRNKNPKYIAIKQKLLSCFFPKTYNSSSVWKIANSWPNANVVFPSTDKLIGAVINALTTDSIHSMKNSRRGTQLKLVLELTNSQLVLFKPSWYSRDEIMNGSVYSGKDRHNSEIVSFHLAAILNLRYTPIVAGRRISLRDSIKYADAELQQTMPVVNNLQCVYGVCHFCKSDEIVCDDQQNGTLEGAVLFTIPGKIIKYRSPWQRTYKEQLKAEWEKNDNYCALISKKLNFDVLLDLIDAAIFDFLIQNGDRHHYETRENRVLLLDNGKGFGNPFVDHIDILAPLYQCCYIRRTTWERLLIFSGGALSETLEELNKLDSLYPLLNKNHYVAIERRLLYIYSTVELCREKFGNKTLK